MKIRIDLDGCDDTTHIELESTVEQFEFLKQVASASRTASTYGCQPRLLVTSLEGLGLENKVVN